MKNELSKDFFRLYRRLQVVLIFLKVRIISYFFNDLTRLHFKSWSKLGHPNYENFSRVINHFSKKPVNILETGTSAWGTDSTRLWDLYVLRCGGSLISVDLRPEASRRLKFQTSKRTRLVISDSVTFIQNYRGPKFDFVYLDSWDVDPVDPLSSAVHGLAEFESIAAHLNPGCWILIDDTPRVLSSSEYIKYPALESFKSEYKQTPGKGALVLSAIASNPNFRILAHDYSLLLEFNTPIK